MKFKDTIYGDLTGQKIIQDIKINDNLTSLTNEKRAEALNFLSKELKSILKLS